MCLIIDAQAASWVFGRKPNNQFGWILQRLLLTGAIGLAMGGQQHDKEMKCSASAEARRAFHNLWESGTAMRVSQHELGQHESRFMAMAGVRSNDWHLLGLAEATGARLLCTDDVMARQDFRDNAVLDPPGEVITSNNECQYVIRVLNEFALCTSGRCAGVPEAIAKIASAG